MMIKAFDAQGGHIYLGLLVSGQLRDDFACDGRQRNALHAVAGGNNDVVIAAGASGEQGRSPRQISINSGESRSKSGK